MLDEKPLILGLDAIELDVRRVRPGEKLRARDGDFVKVVLVVQELDLLGVPIDPVDLELCEQDRPSIRDVAGDVHVDRVVVCGDDVRRDHVVLESLLKDVGFLAELDEGPQDGLVNEDIRAPHDVGRNSP